MSSSQVHSRAEEEGNDLPTSLPGPEIWGGVECSVNRVGDNYYDQFERSGHKERDADLDQIVELGIRALRYPILWEHHANEPVDWSWADQRMGRLREFKIEPIVGLIHHGSGPRDTHLLDPKFPAGLADHAGRVAQRFPWIKYYNPVNEPVTTARFSGLYGHWYPHGRDTSTFHRALLTECQAVRAAMKAIRLHNPKAMLVQTEDMGRTYSTPALQYQADFDNARRWLSLDLLCGRLNKDHPLWGFLMEHGLRQEELESFLEDPCPPDIIGINYYITSERFLDERLERYPARSHGGNGRHRYADVSAVRVSGIGIAGPYGILHEAWQRYQLPLAVTEAHLGCTRDEQLRWLIEVWDAAKRLKNEGCDLRAVTVWSLLGAYDWNSLLTRNDGYYEPGVFDLRAPRPRPTALARCVQALTHRGDHQHPILQQEGWWRRPSRLLYPVAYPAVTHHTPGHPNPRRCRSREHAPLLITGATGTLGRAFQRLCEVRGLPCRLVSRQEMDIASARSVADFIRQANPWAIINTAGYVRVDDAEREPDTCFRENTTGPTVLATACAERRIPFLTFSSDLVFDGAKQSPYLETDPVSPLNVYGQSKAEAERKVLEMAPGSLVIRTSAFFGPWDNYNFVTTLRQKLLAGEEVRAVVDAKVSPTYVPDLVHASLDLLIDGETGIWHLANQGAMSWFELGKMVARQSNLPEELVIPITLAEAEYAARRPVYSVLGSHRGQVMPNLEDALARYLEECRWTNQEGVNSELAGCTSRSQSESTEAAAFSSSVGI
jgi:dTDP-4-dehydrorhamnose reductase